MVGLEALQSILGGGGEHLLELALRGLELQIALDVEALVEDRHLLALRALLDAALGHDGPAAIGDDLGIFVSHGLDQCRAVRGHEGCHAAIVDDAGLGGGGDAGALGVARGGRLGGGLLLAVHLREE